MRRYLDGCCTTIITLILIGLVGCRADRSACEQALSMGEYLFNTENACGCDRRECPIGTVCFKGGCCDPTTSVAKTDPQRCGCKQTCRSGDACSNGECADPTTADRNENCGLKGACKSPDTCQKVGTGYECVCNPKLAISDPNRCGCEKPGDPRNVCDPKWQRCRNSMCECDPLNTNNYSNDDNCACRGACIDGTAADKKKGYCYNGQCLCKSATDVLCQMPDGKFQCVNKDICGCDPNKPATWPRWAQTDPRNCGCKGPCQPGELCNAGRCECDPVAHANDNLDCGCTGIQCNTDGGQSCVGGACVCPPDSCGVRSGACVKCGLGEKCQTNIFGDRTCVCDPLANLNNSQDCACNGKCPTGTTNQGVPLVCKYGKCTCPEGYYLCNPAGNLASGIQTASNICWPVGSTRNLCANCWNWCDNPTFCNYEYDMAGTTITKIVCK